MNDRFSLLLDYYVYIKVLVEFNPLHYSDDLRNTVSLRDMPLSIFGEQKKQKTYFQIEVIMRTSNCSDKSLRSIRMPASLNVFLNIQESILSSSHRNNYGSSSHLVNT